MSISLMHTFRASKRIDDFTEKQTRLLYEQYVADEGFPTNLSNEEPMSRQHWERSPINTYSLNPVSPSEILRGSVLYYIDPLEPVALDDWEALS